MLTIIIFGASGDLATKKTFPALWTLFLNEKLPPSTNIVGYARSMKTVNQVVEGFQKHCTRIAGNEEKFEQFVMMLHYFCGLYDSNDDFGRLQQYLHRLEGTLSVNRLFYFTLPPAVYTAVSSSVKAHLCDSSIKGWKRVVVEKPFGTDLDTSNALSDHLKTLFEESQIYRIDHYLGKEMVQNLMVLRFTNTLFSSLWSRESVSCVRLSFKETISTYGRGGYYDNVGVIRDFIQNHVLQVMALIGMELPRSFSASDVIDQKVKFLRCIQPIKLDNVVLGQYVGDKDAPERSLKQFAYKDDPGVPNNSDTATFAAIVCYVDNDRWRDVPFLIVSGKALDERRGEVCVQLKRPPVDHLLEGCEYASFQVAEMAADTITFAISPKEKIDISFQCKVPGLDYKFSTAHMDVKVFKQFKEGHFFDAYEKLFVDVINGSHTNFVRSDELEESWKLFTPLLRSIENGDVHTLPYTFGSYADPCHSILNLPTR